MNMISMRWTYENSTGNSFDTDDHDGDEFSFMAKGALCLWKMSYVTIM